jgi:uncharacterized protein YlaI
MLSKNDYKKICKQLNLFGFRSYKEFVSSDLWKEFRKVLYKKELPVACSVCYKDSKYFHLHHTSYKRLLDPRLVRWVCEDCHQKVHKETERSIQENTVELYDELNGDKFERRVNSLRVVESSGLPEVLHHSIHASGLVNKAKEGEDVKDLLGKYRNKKIKINDRMLLNLLNENYDKAIEFLETFYN